MWCKLSGELTGYLSPMEARHQGELPVNYYLRKLQLVEALVGGKVTVCLGTVMS